MKSARSIAAMVLTGVFALSGIQVSFGQLAPAPGSPGGIPQPSPVPQPVPPGTLPGLTVYRGSHIVGATAILYNGAPIGTAQDIVFVNGVGEYVLVSYARGFLTIPRRLTTFEPISRVLRVNMTAAQLSELPLLLQVSQLNPQFIERVYAFFRTPHGQSILKNGVARNPKPTRPAGGAQNRGETRTASKPAIGPQTRNEPHPANGADVHR